MRSSKSELPVSRPAASSNTTNPRKGSRFGGVSCSLLEMCYLSALCLELKLHCIDAAAAGSQTCTVADISLLSATPDVCRCCPLSCLQEGRLTLGHQSLASPQACLVIAMKSLLPLPVRTSLTSMGQVYSNLGMQHLQCEPDLCAQQVVHKFDKGSNLL